MIRAQSGHSEDTNDREDYPPWCKYAAQTVSHLAQRFELRLHDELIFTELAAARVGALDPLL